MKPTPQKIARIAMLAALVAGVTGCIVINVQTKTPKHAHRSGKDSCCGGPTSRPGTGSTPGTGEPGTGEPTGNFGTVYTHTDTALGSPGTICFPLTKGWDKYFVLEGYIVGPNTAPISPSYPNTDNSTRIRIQTCNESNIFWGTTLETGIVIQRDDAPSIKQCRTNALQCAWSTKLTTNRLTMASGKYYRVTVYYKSASLPPGQTNITVDWFYEP
jgi:hypothetical protein